MESRLVYLRYNKEQSAMTWNCRDHGELEDAAAAFQHLVDEHLFIESQATTIVYGIVT